MIGRNLIGKLQIIPLLKFNGNKNIYRFVFEILTNPLVNGSNRVFPASTVLLNIFDFHRCKRNSASCLVAVFVNETNQRGKVLGHHLLNIQM